MELEEKEIEIETFGIKAINGVYEEHPEILELLVKYFVRNSENSEISPEFLNYYI